MPKLIDRDGRRAEIAEALWRIVLREGASGVSVREVAAEANISVGSLRHVFADKEELLEFSMRLIYERVAVRIRRHDRIRNPLRWAEAVLSEVLPLDDERRVEMHVNLAMVTESVAHPGLADAAREAHDGLRSLCRTVLGVLDEHGLIGAGRDLDSHAVAVHALVDGLAMHLLLADTDSPARAQRVLREHLTGLAVEIRETLQ
ncbi:MULTISPECIES: TetR family transcriptional regulator C-terminal domain-containing protein [Gordonia]|jgi:AcrR family transcriptional regulator|uniref:TetR family transcriptional regulator C-terminal domain-containing protein n=1 Tax=Gordonia hongkongensis TaxID=1701090 RepID=A0ABT6BUQ9_9ACTN|nr:MULTISPECIES: TetR family transcriptional regulator C-terminal domain-containing protein [Gordonia]MBN0975037.1 TetR/AcrR family transcriptional regulator [Gordonia sp. BP-119]MBN0985071.1 TetR/AcrR family transcriptional regulator [Gordonia sp. BP-94]MDF6101332.1 TetR family transcriptional regulator C-terminal domain-containing protein [Gordonia hongkongensis]